MRPRGTQVVEKEAPKKYDLIRDPLDGIVRLLRKLEQNDGTYTTDLLDNVLGSHNHQQAIIKKAHKCRLIMREREGFRKNNYITDKGKDFLRAVDIALTEE